MTNEAQRAMGVQAGSSGGYTVPPKWAGAKQGKKKTSPQPLSGAAGTAKRKGGK